MSGGIEPPEPHQSRAKLWTFRALAVLLGLSPALGFETTLHVIDWQPPTPIVDPFVGFQSVRPLFVADAESGMMVTATDRLEYFRPESFPIAKDAGAFRIVCLGGSTVQGRPYAIETSFSTWLELSLRAADSSRDWDVINCGGVSYASYRLVPIAMEMLRYQPDLIILYTGHNEFLEDRAYGLLKSVPDSVASLYARLSRLKSVQYLLTRFGDGPPTGNPAINQTVLSTEVEALLDDRGGLEKYRRDAAWRHQVVQHFEFNVRRIIRLASRAGVPVLIVDPPANLRDCPPFKSQPTNGLTAEQIAMTRQLVARAIDIGDRDPGRAIQLLEQAVIIDPDHAGIQFQLGTLYARTSRFAAAKNHLQAALDEDICPLRITSPLSRVLRKVTIDSDTPCVEARQRFEQLSKGTIPGKNLFVDHVHPSFRGHQLIATEIMNELHALKIVEFDESWTTKRDALFSEHWKSLDPVYFERGLQRLSGLKRWTQGRAEKLRKQGNAK